MYCARVFDTDLDYSKSLKIHSIPFGAKLGRVCVAYFMFIEVPASNSIQQRENV